MSSFFLKLKKGNLMVLIYTIVTQILDKISG